MVSISAFTLSVDSSYKYRIISIGVFLAFVALDEESCQTYRHNPIGRT